MSSRTTALILPGGGVRGAYEVGVVAGIVNVLGLRANDRAPFQIFTGASVGAINAAYLAANTDRGDLSIDKLKELWLSLNLDIYIKPRLPRRFLRHPFRFGGALLDPTALEELVTTSIPWNKLHANADAGHLGALIVTALDVASGRTTMFSEIGRGFEFRPSLDPSRHSVQAIIDAQHILASAALPVIFPSRRINGRLYVDGGLRFNTPIAPAIRSGADRLVIVPTLFHRKRPADVVEGQPSQIFMAGKLLNALIADRVDRDLQVLQRFNRLLEVVDEVVTREERVRFDQVTTETRGAPYRRLDTLIVRPSEDIGEVAGEHIRNKVRGPMGWVFRQLLKHSGSREADWGSYTLFDGEFANSLIELGERDALAKADEIRAFFA